jgi:hypothetical protein
MMIRSRWFSLVFASALAAGGAAAGSLATEAPHIVEGAGWRTTILITNLSPVQAKYLVVLRDDAAAPGTRSSLPIRGEGRVSELSGILEPNQSREVATPGDTPFLVQGSASIYTMDTLVPPRVPSRDSKLGVSVVYHRQTENGGEAEAAAVLTPWVGETPQSLFFDNRNGDLTGIAIRSDEQLDTYPAQLYCRMIVTGPSGEKLLESVVNTIGLKMVFLLEERYPELRGKSGKVTLESSPAPLAISSLRFNQSGSFSSTPTTATGAFLEELSGQLLAPHVVDGAGWQTAFFLTNPQPDPVHYWLVIGSRNTPAGRGIEIKGKGSASSVWGTLQPGESVHFETTGDREDLAQGSVSVNTLRMPLGDSITPRPAPNKLAGFVTYRRKSAEQSEAMASAPFFVIAADYVATLVFDNRNGRSTGIALQNYEWAPGAMVSVTARDLDGAVLLSTTINMMYDERLTFSLADRFPELRDRQGILQVKTLYGEPIGVVALRFTSSGGFTALPILTLPR